MRSHSMVLFKEVQHLREQKLSLVILPGGLFLLVYAIYALIQQIGRGIPVGDQPMSDQALLLSAALWVVLGSFLLVLFFYGRLITEVRETGLYIRFVPFHRKFRHIDLADVESFAAVTYRPIRDYGGWGIRIGLKGRAYNVSGNRGLELVFRDGRRLLIGSRKADMLAEVLRAAAK